MRPSSFVGTCAWIFGTILAVSLASVFLAPAVAQTCEDRNPLHAVALLGRLQGYCERNDVPWSFDLFGLASVAGEEAIPALRKIAAWPIDRESGNRCQEWVALARIALAKLGVTAMPLLRHSFRETSRSHSPS